MNSNLLLKKATEFDANKCIICQKGKDLVSTENGRTKIIEAASIRKDIVIDRLNSLKIDKPFKYHMNNACYKMYTMKKTLDKFKVRILIYKS
jgi:hypothetical protein